jgi:two-component system, OmpR family, alkaline phosphatase synthesis response regulator PhoP
MPKKKILVVDDEPTLISILSARLNFAGYEVLTASNGVQALEMAAKHSPHLVLLDIMMPEMDGFSVLIKMKENKKTRSIVIVMLTSKNETETIEKALQLGAVDYIVKPFNPGVLLDKLKKLLGKR